MNFFNVAKQAQQSARRGMTQNLFKAKNSINLQNSMHLRHPTARGFAGAAHEKEEDYYEAIKQQKPFGRDRGESWESWELITYVGTAVCVSILVAGAVTRDEANVGVFQWAQRELQIRKKERAEQEKQNEK